MSFGFSGGCPGIQSVMCSRAGYLPVSNAALVGEHERAIDDAQRGGIAEEHEQLSKHVAFVAVGRDAPSFVEHRKQAYAALKAERRARYAKQDGSAMELIGPSRLYQDSDGGAYWNLSPGTTFPGYRIYAGDDVAESGAAPEVRELTAAAERHVALVLVADRFDEQAFLGLAGHDRRAGVAPFHHRRAGIEPEAALLLVDAMTLEAVGGENRPDRLLEELDLLSRRGRRRLRSIRRYRAWLRLHEGEGHEPGRRAGANQPRFHASTPLTTEPKLSVSRNSRPL